MGKRVLLILGVGLAVMACIFLFMNHKEKGPANNPQEMRKEVPLLEARGISLTEWNEKGEKIWEVQADSGMEFAKETILSKARVSFFEEGALASEGKVEKVLVNNQTSELILQGRVRLVSHTDGAELLTSNLRWIPSEEKLCTNERVFYKRGNLIMEGFGLIANPDLSQIEIKEDVTTRVI